MKNMFKFAAQCKYDLCFLPNNWKTSTINYTKMKITIGTLPEVKEIFDVPFLILMHEIGHLENREEFVDSIYFLFGGPEDMLKRERDAWKLGLEEYFTFNPIIREKALRYIQSCFNDYLMVQKYRCKINIYGEMW